MVEIKEVSGESSSNVENEVTPSEGAVQLQANGEAPAEHQQAAQENAHQPTRMESFFSITKSLILRALIFYFITSFFRRPAPAPAEQGVAAPGVKLPSFNYFQNGSTMVIEDEF